MNSRDQNVEWSGRGKGRTPALRSPCVMTRLSFLLMILPPMILCPRAVAQRAFFEKHCYDCHNGDEKNGGLNLTTLKSNFSDTETFAVWVKVHDRIQSGEMPPKKEACPPAKDTAAVTKWLRDSLVAAERARTQDGRTRIRRLTRGEYENTMRDLFDLPGLAVAGELPPDGSAHGFDNNSDALDISHVNLAKYLEAADYTLNLATATQPQAPTVQKKRLSLSQHGSSVAHVLLHGDGVLLRDKKPDPEFPPAGAQEHLDEGAHERMGAFERGSTVGLFRPEDESFSPYFAAQVTIYPGRYRVRTSLWSFQWDKGQVLPSRGTETARLSVVQLTGDGRGQQHPSYVLGYFDAPSLESKEHEMTVWLNHNEILGFNAASLSPAETRGKLRAMGATVPGIACDWLDIEGPLHDVWPPRSHCALFGELPLVEWKADANPSVRAPLRKATPQIGPGKNRPDPDKGLWTVRSEQPLVDADKLLAAFLPKAFRRPVAEEMRKTYVAKVDERLKAGDCFESAMRWGYRAALCSPDFLYHVEPDAKLDDHALACRLSYFLWNSMPDARLTELATSGKLREALHDEVERMLKDAKFQRFIEDFPGQWLKLRAIAANDPDKKLYPEFNPYLQDSMVAETRAYLRETIEQNLDVSHLVRSDFAMLNEKLAVHYGIPGVTGSKIRRVALPPDCPRGGFLTQASVLKVTANGTTTSPVPRGAFVMARLLGQPPDPPPPGTPAVEPDVRGTTTIREQLDKHRADPSCAGCHAKMDPPGFALESFDVIGGFRDHYRAMRADGIMSKDGPPVDASGVLPDERKFSGIREFQTLLAADKPQLLKNLAEQLAIYSTGRDIAFSDRAEIAGIVARTQQQGGGLRTLIHELIGSALCQTR